jgi:hypothetical protein
MSTMPLARIAKIAGFECRVITRLQMYNWQAWGLFQGREIEVAGFATQEEAYRAWKRAAIESCQPAPPAALPTDQPTIGNERSTPAT